MSKKKSNAVVAQSGGPTCVINETLVGVVEECVASDCIAEIYGARRGVSGVLAEEFLDLGREWV